MRKLIIALLVLSSCTREQYEPVKMPMHTVHVSKHVCPFVHCPFKGAMLNYHDSCTCIKGSMCYQLDSLHMIYPYASYDEIDALLP